MSNFRPILKKIYLFFLKYFFRTMYETRETACCITFKKFFFQKIVGINRKAYWPMHFTSRAVGIENIYVGIGSAPGDSFGCYIQGIASIKIGNYVRVAPNVGIISANHNFYNNSKHDSSNPIIIGDYSWIGMNSVILPGVMLGDFTIVGAGSVVTKSFPDGYCVIAGNPAKLIKKLDPEKCVRYKYKYEYYGYYSKNKFEKNTNKSI